MTTVAIDFGTTNTVISYLEPAAKKPISVRLDPIARVFQQKLRDGKTVEIPVIPSLVYIHQPEQWSLGQIVRAKSLGLQASQKDRLFKAFKRELVADFQSPPRLIDGIAYTPEMICEGFLQQLWGQLRQQNIHPTQAIFTVPVEAFERYLDWFRDLAPKLGLESLQIIDESTAAALGYTIQRPGSLVLVIDFGGGTLDISLVRISTIDGRNSALKAEAIAKSGAYVGGEDVDQWIMEHYLRSQGMGLDRLNNTAKQALLDIAEKVKTRLSSQETAKESWFDEDTFTSYEIKLSRQELEGILEERQFQEQLRGCLDEVLTFALSRGIDKSQMERVLLTGGTSMMPAVRQLVVSYFGKAKVAYYKPFEAVCHGALCLGQVSRVDDYLRHSYVIRLWQPSTQSYIYHPLFEAGTKYPCQNPDPLVLQTANANQPAIRLNVGELAKLSQSEVIYDEQGRLVNSELHSQQSFRSLNAHHDLVTFTLDPPGQMSGDRLTVLFEVNDKRELLATVQDLLTGRQLAHKTPISKLE
jgi:molecular chaperone DnaK (HSP70)